MPDDEEERDAVNPWALLNKFAGEKAAAAAATLERHATALAERAEDLAEDLLRDDAYKKLAGQALSIRAIYIERP